MAILAVIQGIAEFLPISSSGHLVIVGRLLGDTGESATTEIILHTGTLASILVVFWRRILSLLSTDRRVIGLLIVGTIPAGVIGVLIKTQAEWIIKSPLLAGCMLLVTAALLVIMWRLPKADGSYGEMSYAKAFIVGCFQACAILPGLSRSGSTIVGGRWMGLKTDDAVTFSFLLAIPAILGATVLELKDLVEDGISGEAAGTLAAGALISFVVGIFALKWLIRWASQDRLHWFAYWCAPVGLIVIALYFNGFFG